ncbi:MAG: glycosyltransferase, partial [Acidiferrobacteraceae bacterium]
PLKENVGSSGQMVALAGMQFAKSVIYPDFDVVAQYFVSGVSGVPYVAGSTESLRETIRNLYPDRDRLKTLGAQARRRWETHFTMTRFESALSEHIDGVLERLRQRER